MTRMYTADVVADSISPEGHRITSVKVVYPHAVHKDMLRHRAHNRNVESFRAQPPEKLIEALRSGHAFMPDVFAKRTKGMGQSHEEISEMESAQALWRTHIENATWVAEEFLKMGIAKQQVNFLIQDLCPLTEIITATDWSNFYALRMERRDDGTPVARPEVYKTAEAIHAAISESTPKKLGYGDHHLPMLTDDDFNEINNRLRLGYPEGYFEVEWYWICVSAGRCARISFGDFDWRNEPREDSYRRAIRLLQSGHMSPFEQQAKPFSLARWDMVAALQNKIRNSLLDNHERDEMCRQLEYSGNLHGWIPARKKLPNEHDYSLFTKDLLTKV